jgi:flagellar basal body P-ring formation protein FlgA
MANMSFFRIFCLTMLLAPACASAGGAQQNMVFAKTAIYSGDTITGNMLIEKPVQPILGSDALVSDPAEAVGKIAKRTILPGQSIPKSLLREPYVVEQGKTASVIFQSGGLTITGVAVTLEGGAPGDIISARNQESGFIIKGQVQPDGSLRVDVP